ncbi:MAG: hypothetical protein RIC55_21470 [Pirellulaceae bacterium]
MKQPQDTGRISKEDHLTRLDLSDEEKNELLDWDHFILAEIPLSVREFAFKGPLDEPRGSSLSCRGKVMPFPGHPRSTLTKVYVSQIYYPGDGSVNFAFNKFQWIDRLLVQIALTTNLGPIELVRQSPNDESIVWSIQSS